MTVSGRSATPSISRVMNGFAFRLVSTLAATTFAAAYAQASTVIIDIDRTPFKADGFDIIVHSQVGKHGYTDFAITIRPGLTGFPRLLSATLVNVDRKPSQFSSKIVRRLPINTTHLNGGITFSVSKADLRQLTFELDQAVEMYGRPVPSVTSYMFPLSKPPLKRK